MSIDQAVRTAPFSDFVGRHVGPRAADVERMLQVVGQPSLEAMCDRALWMEQGQLIMDGPAEEVVDAYHDHFASKRKK